MHIPWPDGDNSSEREINPLPDKMGVLTRPCRHGNYVVRITQDEAWPAQIRTYAVLILLNAN